MNNLLGENLLKFPDHFFDSIVDERACIHYRAALNPWISFAELYRYLKIRIHIHLKGNTRSKFSNYCAVFGYNAIADTLIPKTTEIDLCSMTNHYLCTSPNHNIAPNFPLSESKTFEFDNSPNNMDDSVFISIVYGLKNPECIIITPIRSFVRLEFLNNCDLFRGNSSKIALDTALIIFDAIEDGEFEIETPFIFDGKLTQLLDKDVKSRTSIMGKIANDKTQLIIGGELAGFSDDDVSWRLGIGLKDKGIWLACDKTIYRFFDSVEVLVCPAKLQPWPIEWMHMLYYPYGASGKSNYPTDYQDSQQFYFTVKMQFKPQLVYALDKDVD